MSLGLLLTEEVLWGDGEAQLRAEGLSVSGSARQSLALKQGEGSPAIFPVTVLDDVEQISVAVALARASDGASDAFAVTLPVRPDQREVVLRTRQTLSMGSPVALPELAGQAGARGVERSVLLTARPELLEAAAACEDDLAAVIVSAFDYRYSRQGRL